MKNLGVRSNTQDIANLEDIPSLSNIVTTDTVQTISAAKTFSKEVAFDNHIRANGSVGTAGQVLTSQGANNAPSWRNVPVPSNMVTTDSAQVITGTKTFSSSAAPFPKTAISANGMTVYSSQSESTIYSASAILRINGSNPSVINLPTKAGTIALTSEIPSNYVTTNTAQSISATKTFDHIDVTLGATLIDCDLTFNSADGAMQSLSIDASLSSSTTTSFVLPAIVDDATYELGTALYCHYITAIGGNTAANFQVFCNRRNEFIELSDLYASIMNNQTATVVYIPATGVLYSSSFANVQIVEAVKFTASKIYICTHYLSKGTSSETLQVTSIYDMSIYSCNRTQR